MAWFVKLERGTVRKEDFDRWVPAHLEFVGGLIREGRQAKTGYWVERGGGMLLFQAASLEEARAIVARDPLVAAGIVEWELHEWKVVVE